MVGDGMLAMVVYVKQGDLSASRTEFMRLRSAEEPWRAEVRAPIVARKRL